MNPTPTGRAVASTSEGEDAEQVDVPFLPGPRSGRQPLPRRSRAVSEPPFGPVEEPGRDPEGRPFEPVDEATLTRLLTGLRDI